MRPSGRRGRTISSSARGAKQTTHHGPLERLLEVTLTDHHCARAGTAPATEANIPPELSAPNGRTRTPVAPSEDAYKTTQSATVRAPQNKSKHPPSSSRR